ncbi:hypothetical protein C2G38_2044865 [Gigaspora rosea]|uniref:BACK domain-containing protein n=1 Tax=Gigaspora rosea TaxID=44941 RepID=A0A397UI61_9GLOM|nr:hypothetical protein C2G38_2044865 [Gigaspora rosea]
MTTKFLEKLSSNLNELLTNGDEYNVIIEVGQVPNNRVFKAHSAILSSRCLYFKNKLKKVDPSDIFNLLIASNEFGLEELVKHIQPLLIENNAPWLRLNFSRVYQTSFKNDNFDALQQFCANIITRHPNIVFDSDDFITLSENILVSILKLDNLQIDEGLIWDHIIKWGIAQNRSFTPNPEQWSEADFLTLKNTLKNCLPLIRYFQISGKHIFEKVRPYQKILDPSLWADIEMKFMVPDQTITSRILPPRSPLLKPLPSRSDQSLTDNENDIELNNIFELRKRGKYYFKTKRYNKALKDLNKALEIGQDNLSILDLISILELRGESYFMIGDYKKALVDLNELNKLLSNSGMLAVRGLAYFLMGRHKEALVDFIKFLEIEPNGTGVFLIFRGEIYRKLGRYEEALADSTRALKVDPNNMITLTIRGLTYRLMGKHNEALADLNKLNELLKIDQNNASLLSDRGTTYFLMGRYKKALADFTKSLEIKHDTYNLTYRAEIYRQMGKYEEALEDLNNALKIDINSEITVLGIRGLTYRSMGKNNEAHADLAKFNKFLEFELNYARILVSRGKTYLMMGRYDDALKDLSNSLEILPNNVFALVHRAETYRLMGKCSEALTDLIKSLEIRPEDVEVIKAHKKLLTDMNKK